MALNDNHLLLRTQLWVTWGLVDRAMLGWSDSTSYCRSVSQQDGSAPCVSHLSGISGIDRACCSHGVGKGQKGSKNTWSLSLSLWTRSHWPMPGPLVKSRLTGQEEQSAQSEARAKVKMLGR